MSSFRPCIEHGCVAAPTHADNSDKACMGEQTIVNPWGTGDRKAWSCAFYKNILRLPSKGSWRNNMCPKQTKDVPLRLTSLKTSYYTRLHKTICTHTHTHHAPLPSSTPPPSHRSPLLSRQFHFWFLSSVHIWLCVSIATGIHRWEKTYGMCLSGNDFISLPWLHPFSGKQLYSAILYVGKIRLWM